MELSLDHVAVAVPSITAALPIFELLADAPGSRIEHVQAQQVDVAFVGTGATRVELLQPSGTDSTVQKFLDRRGPGLHHIGYAVDDVEEEAGRLSAQGLRRVDLGPGAGAAFFYPQDVHGVLTEFVPFRTPGMRAHTGQQ